MSADNSFSVDFVLRLTKRDKTKGYLFARITVNGEQPAEISLKQKVAVKQWDSKAERIIGKSEDVLSINKYIENVRFRITKSYRSLEEQEALITVELVKNTYLGKQTIAPKGRKLSELLNEHAKIATDDLVPGTMKNYKTTKKYLENFIKHYHQKDDIFLAQIDYEFITNFCHYIPRNPIKPSDPCTANGTTKHIERLKKLIAWAKKLQWISENKVEDFVPPRKKFKRKKLHMAQFVKIEKKIFYDPAVSYVKDLFLFGCYTGMGYAETLSLTQADFEVSGAGKVWTTKYRQKSGELLLKSRIPLKTVQLLLGHKKLSSTERYAEVDEEKIEGDTLDLETVLSNANVQPCSQWKLFLPRNRYLSRRFNCLRLPASC